jgi:SlyX protein
MTDIRQEEELAHLRRACDDLGAEVRRQGLELDRLARQVALLMRRAAEAESAAAGGIVLGDERPPHW